MAREIAPFEYWERYSSAFVGFGGADQSPDPQYCFHTSYHHVRHGRAQFVLKLAGLRASFGELSMRVHAWKPDSDSGVSLVAGARTLLQAEADSDLTLAVRFSAQREVLYALYGYLSEDSDVTAQVLQILIEEPDDIDGALPEPTRSFLAVNAEGQETRPANAMVHFGSVTIGQPVSQSCTLDQVTVLGLSARDGDAAIVRWSEKLCRNGLRAYCSIEPGMEAMLIGPATNILRDDLAKLGLVVQHSGDPPPPRTSHDFFDIIVMPSDNLGSGNVRHRWEVVENWLARLKIGGLAIITLQYQPDCDLVSSSASLEHPMLSRNEIGQWALRLVSSNYSIAPLAFAPTSALFLDSDGLATFSLIVQRM